MLQHQRSTRLFGAGAEPRFIDRRACSLAPSRGDACGRSSACSPPASSSTTPPRPDDRAQALTPTTDMIVARVRSMERTVRFRGLICALALALAACGSATRLVYDSAEPAVLVIANRYLALEGDQWKRARIATGRFHAWHRRNELPRYAALFAEAAGRVQRG